MDLIKITRALAAGVFVAMGFAFPAQALVTYSWSAGAACGNPATASFNTGGPTIQASLCVSTTTERGCGFSAILQAGTALESNAFSVTARTLGSNYVDANATPTFPLLIANPPIPADFGATTAVGASSAPAGANQLLATFTFQPQAAATNDAYVITMSAVSEFSTDQGVTSCGSSANSGAALPTLTLARSTAPVFTSAPTATFTVAATGSFNVTATGVAASTFTAAGLLPGGVTLSNAGVLSGTPASGSAGTYPLTITATNANLQSGTQPFSLVVAKRSQSISFGSIASQQRNASPFALLATAASASSGLPLAFASSTANVCTVSGAVVNFVSVGTCGLTANQAGNVDFNAAVTASQSFVITASVPGAPTIGSASRSSTQAVIAFAPPASNGGSTITGYTTSCSPGAISATATASPITLSGLATDATYTCSVIATNSAGSGPASSTVTITPLSQPVSLTSNANPAAYGAAVTLIASVGGNGQTGTVTFSILTTNGPAVLPGCAAVPVISGVASCIAPGTYQSESLRQYLAAYSGDTNNPSSNAVFLQTVAVSPAVLTVAAFPLPPVVSGHTTTLTALVKMNNPAGTVTFHDNGVAITGCAQKSLSILPDAVDSAVATCTVTVPVAASGVKQYVVSYFYPVGHVSGRVFEQAIFDMRVLAAGPLDYTDMWWAGVAENGWGMSVTQHGAIQFNVIFAYDNNGKSIWYVMPGGSFNAAGTVFTGPLYLPTSSPFNAYDRSKFVIGASVGSATITYSSNMTATLAYTINGVSANKPLQRQIFSAETTGPNLRTNDLWWATAAEDGWGMNISQQGRVLFPIWYTYNEAGRATFFTAQGGRWNGTVWSGTVYAHESSPWLGVKYDPTLFKAINVGTISLDFSDASSATMTTTVNDFTQVRRIERQPY